MSIKNKIAIVGGGVVGLCSAYYLRREGFEVEVFDRTDGTDNCSFGNAGLIVPSHIVPLASPGKVAQGLRWMFNPESPFYIKPRLNADLMRWAWLFYRKSTAKHVEHSIPHLKQFNLFSKQLFDGMSNNGLEFELEKRGLMMMFNSDHGEEEEHELAAVATEAGLEANLLSAEQVQALEPELKLNIKGGVHYPGDAHLTPRTFMNTLRKAVESSGVKVHWNTEVTDFSVNGKQINALKTVDSEHTFDELIVAGGSWSGLLARKLKLRLPLQPGKGYSITVPSVKKQLQIPAVLVESAVAVTPMGNDLRFAGTMEIAGINHNVNPRRVQGIINSASKFMPDIQREDLQSIEAWNGLRPVSPDGLPYIGRTKRWNNVTIASGHAMMGLSLGPGTGKMVSEIISNQSTSLDIAPYNPDRYA